MDVKLVKEFAKLSDEDQACVLCRCSVPPTDAQLKAAMKYVEETHEDDREVSSADD